MAKAPFSSFKKDVKEQTKFYSVSYGVYGNTFYA